MQNGLGDDFISDEGSSGAYSMENVCCMDTCGLVMAIICCPFAAIVCARDALSWMKLSSLATLTREDDASDDNIIHDNFSFSSVDSDVYSMVGSDLDTIEGEDCEL